MHFALFSYVNSRLRIAPGPLEDCKTTQTVIRRIDIVVDGSLKSLLFFDFRRQRSGYEFAESRVSPPSEYPGDIGTEPDLPADKDQFYPRHCP